jgi:hypothetical protein
MLIVPMLINNSFSYQYEKQPFPKTYDRPKTTEECEILKYLGSMLTNDGRCTREIKSRIARTKVAFNKKRAPLTIKMDIELRKKLIKF